MARRKTRHGLTVIENDREALREEILEALVNVCVYKGAKARQAKKKLHEIDKRLSRRAELRLVTAHESSS